MSCAASPRRHACMLGYVVLRVHDLAREHGGSACSTSSCARRRRSRRRRWRHACQRTAAALMGPLRRKGDDFGPAARLSALRSMLDLRPGGRLAYFNLGNMLPRGLSHVRTLAARSDAPRRVDEPRERPPVGRPRRGAAQGVAMAGKDRPGGGAVAPATNALIPRRSAALEVASLWKRAADAGRVDLCADAVEWHAEGGSGAAGAEAAPKSLARRCIEGFEEAACCQRRSRAPRRTTAFRTAGGTSHRWEASCCSRRSPRFSRAARAAGRRPRTWDAAYLSGEAGADELEVSWQLVDARVRSARRSDRAVGGRTCASPTLCGCWRCGATSTSPCCAAGAHRPAAAARLT